MDGTVIDSNASPRVLTPRGRVGVIALTERCGESPHLCPAPQLLLVIVHVFFVVEILATAPHGVDDIDSWYDRHLQTSPAISRQGEVEWSGCHTHSLPHPQQAFTGHFLVREDKQEQLYQL